jgi:arginyl-tRNA--protein-N-Asp/Glu arginylyltransferase
MNYIFQLQEPLAPEVMDILLSQGFYRMRQTVFTTTATVADDGRTIEVFWARILLNGFTPGSRHKELTRRCRRFSRTLQPAVVNEEIESLYRIYAQGVHFDAPETVAAFLMGDSTENYFPARMWQVRDGDQLIAVGYFDEGTESAAGILNFYHPDYKKFSLGKWLYLESVLYAAATGKQYFYPGYIALDFPKFDYKLLAGKDRMELWDIITGEWTPYATSVHAQQIR